MNSTKRRKVAHDAPKKKPVVAEKLAKVEKPPQASPEPSSEEESATVEAPSTEEVAEVAETPKTFKDLVCQPRPCSVITIDNH